MLENKEVEGDRLYREKGNFGAVTKLQKRETGETPEFNRGKEEGGREGTLQEER